MNKIFACLLALLFSMTSAATEPAKVLLLGTFHFANPGKDVVKTSVFNVSSNDGQQQVMQLVERLNRFKPTKVLLEFEPSRNDEMNQRYQDYRNGELELGINEIYQLGFRLAAMNDHPAVYGIDEREVHWSGDKLFAYAEQYEPAVYADMQQQIAQITETKEREQTTKSLIELIRLENTPASLRQNLGFYIKYNDLGVGDGFAGADSTASWFERNIRMHALVQQYAQPDERLLVIAGAGHAAVMNLLIDNDPRLQRVDALDYLD